MAKRLYGLNEADRTELRALKEFRLGQSGSGDIPQRRKRNSKGRRANINPEQLAIITAIEAASSQSELRYENDDSPIDFDFKVVDQPVVRVVLLEHQLGAIAEESILGIRNPNDLTIAELEIVATDIRKDGTPRVGEIVYVFSIPDGKPVNPGDGQIPDLSRFILCDVINDTDYLRGLNGYVETKAVTKGLVAEEGSIFWTEAFSGPIGPQGEEGPPGKDGTGDSVSEGYAIDAEVDGINKTIHFDPTEITLFDGDKMQFFTHFEGAEEKEDPVWKTAVDYDSGAVFQLLVNFEGEWEWATLEDWSKEKAAQFIIQNLGDMKWETITGYVEDAAITQQLIHTKGDWAAVDAFTVKVTKDDPTASYLHDALKHKVAAATFVSTRDVIIQNETDVGNETELLHWPSDKIVGYKAAGSFLLTLIEDKLKWTDPVGFITITEGCGIDITGTAISVDPVDLAGDGLDVQGDICKLKVFLDECTMKFTEDKSIAVDLTNIAGAGLKANLEEAACELEVVPGLGIAPTAPNDDVGLYDTGHAPASTAGQVYGHVLNTFQHFTIGCGLEIVTGVLRVKVADLNTGGNCALTFSTGSGGDTVAQGCGIIITGTAPKIISVDIEALAGLGLGTETSGGVCQLRVKIGCGLTTDTIGDTIRINPVAIAGPGLGVGASNEADMDGPCELKVNVDLGLEIDGDDVQIHDTDYNATAIQVYGHDAAAVFRHFTIGCGLEIATGVLKIKPADLNFGGTCALSFDSVAAGCGITISGTSPKTISVNATALAGNGLVPNTAGGLCALDVNPGCNIEIVDDKVQVKLSALAGAGLGIETSGDPALCELKINVDLGLEIDADAVQIHDTDYSAGAIQMYGHDAAAQFRHFTLGCGLEIVAGVLRIKTSDLNAGGACALTFSGGGAGPTEGYCTDISSVTNVDLDLRENATYVSAAQQFLMHFNPAPNADSWVWQTVLGYSISGGANQVLINDGSNVWTWRNAYTVKVSSDDTTANYLLQKFETSGAYEIAEDFVVKVQEINGAGDEKLRLFIESDGIGGWVASSNQILGHTTAGTPVWRTVAEWLNLLPGYNASNNQSIGHDAAGATMWQDDKACP